MSQVRQPRATPPPPDPPPSSRGRRSDRRVAL